MPRHKLHIAAALDRATQSEIIQSATSIHQGAEIQDHHPKLTHTDNTPILEYKIQSWQAKTLLSI
jgi:hypothetical protein